MPREKRKYITILIYIVIYLDTKGSLWPVAAGAQLPGLVRVGPSPAPLPLLIAVVGAVALLIL